MSIWIVTTGNSDVILKHDRTWSRFHNEASDHLECSDFGSASRVNPDDRDAGFTVPARVLGLVYKNQSEEYYEDDLKFPLFDTYCKYLIEKNIEIEKIIILLTDQSQIFSSEEQRLHQKSPYWKDTCTLKPLLVWYFQGKKFTCQPEFEYLIPHPNHPGVDNWDATLSLVDAKLQELEIDANQEVYVSHQAGTPAISSAIQFVTLGKFKKVHFLVSNEYLDENYELKSKSDIVESSRYQRGMQIQKAKQLIVKGLPAAAKEILTDIADNNTIKEINEIVDLFNINNFLFRGKKFDVPSAVDRIVTALDLIEIFFQQENYIQGIAILNATQETFLKAAILSQKKKINDIQINLSSIIDWNKNGFFIKSQQEIIKLLNVQNPLNILTQIKFPHPIERDSDVQFWDKYQNQRDRNFKLNNSRQFKWLCELKQDFKPWAILSWSCQYERIKEDDLRNQLLHNLVGVEKIEVRDYICGYNNDSIKRIEQLSNKSNQINEQLSDKPNQINEVDEAYKQNVKTPFLKSLKLFGLLQENTIENRLQNKLQQIADSIT